LKQVDLSANLRKSSGNGPARVLRREGAVPAVLYGPTTPPVMLAVNVRDLEHVVQKGNIRRTIFSLTVQDGSSAGPKSTVIKELQTHPVTGQFLHVDFYEIDMNRKLRIMVPLVTQGKAKGEEDGGMLQIIEREIEVFCLPREIPDSLTIDVSALGIGEALHVKDLALPAGVELPPAENYTLVTVVSPKAEAVPVAAVAEGEAVEGAEAPAEEKTEAAAE
jgi:large subunit ribosomal protein L25